MSSRLFEVRSLEPDVPGALAELAALPVPPGERLRLAPLNLKAANRVLAALHRHSEPVQGMKFATRALIANEHVGIAVAGRPSNRNLDDGLTLEVLRVCTWTDQRNVCSKLYGACCRAGAALGHVLAVTYTTDAETAASVRAAGFMEAGRRRAGSWDCESRPRDIDHHDLAGRVRWERAL